MQKLNRHYYAADLKNWKWNPETNNIDEYYEEVEKDFTKKELNAVLRESKLSIIGCTLLGMIVGCLGFMGTWISGLIFIGVLGFIGLACGFLQYYIDHYKSPYRYYLGEQDGWMEDKNLQYIFLEEIAQRYENKLEQEKLAEKWRKKHPLEEKIRMAMTGNPNYVADLLRYCELVKPNKLTEQQRIKREEQKKKEELAKKSIQVRYLGEDL